MSRKRRSSASAGVWLSSGGSYLRATASVPLKNLFYRRLTHPTTFFDCLKRQCVKSGSATKGKMAPELIAWGLC